MVLETLTLASSIIYMAECEKWKMLAKAIYNPNVSIVEMYETTDPELHWLIDKIYNSPLPEYGYIQVHKECLEKAGI